MWLEIAPHLEDALEELSEPDRDAVLLRYFKNHDLRTVGATLGISDDAAQKRVSRAVERLREFFAKRGVTVGTSGLAVVISTNAVQAAPVGLALTISAAAAVLTGTTLATTASVTATKAIVMTALQKTIVTATIAVLAGAGIYEARQAAQLREQVQMFQQQQVPLPEQVLQLQRERDDAKRRLAALQNTYENSDRQSELLRLRGKVALLSRQYEEVLQHNPTTTLANKVSLSNETEVQAKELQALESQLRAADTNFHLASKWVKSIQTVLQVPEEVVTNASFLANENSATPSTYGAYFEAVRQRDEI